MSEPNGTGNTSPGLTTAAVLLLVWASLTYAVRVWVKLRTTDSWGSDDTTISCSAAAILAGVITTCYSVHHGYGSPWSVISGDERATIYRALYASQVFYVVSVGLTKISTSFFTARFLTRDKSNIRLTNGITGICAAWTVASILVIAIRRPLNAPWEALDGTGRLQYRWIGIEAFGLSIDLCSLGLAVYFIWTLNMPVGKRIMVSVIFASRLAITPIVALRLWYLSPAKNDNPDHPSITAEIFTHAVMSCAFMLASVTCLKPFLRPFHAGYITTVRSANPTGYSTAAKNSRADAYFELSVTRTGNTARQKHASLVHTQSVGEDGDEVALVQPHAAPVLALRPDGVEHRANALADRGRRSQQIEGEEMMISKTQAWTVSYEGR